MGSTTDSRHPTDWERQREQLSALVDGELSPDQRAELEVHLATCPECQEELAHLRRIRALLGALPTAAVPRSFALPTGTRTPVTPRTARRDTNAGHERADPGALYRASRWVGGVAASLGLALLLGSALMGILSSGYGGAASTTSSALGAQSSHPPYTPTNDATQPGAIIVQSPATTPAATMAPPQASTQPERNLSAEGDTLPLGPLAGAGLLAGGMIVLAAGWAARRRD